MPVDTGDLRKRTRARTPKIDGDTVEAKVVANTEYALYVEMGTGPVGEAIHDGIDPNANPTYCPEGWVYPTKDGGYKFTLGQPAQPFMYPAKKQNEQRAQEIIADEIQKAVEK